MIVLDASAAIDLLLGLAPFSSAIARRVQEAAPSIAAPHLVDAEVGQVLRRFVLAGKLQRPRAIEALLDLAALPIVRYPHGPLLERAFELRNHVTIYDALYLALGEALRAPVVTRDAALTAVPGCRARVDLVA